MVTVQTIQYFALHIHTGKMLTGMVRADFEGLIAPHHEPDLLGLLVLQQTDVARPAFLPLRGFCREPEELRTPMPHADGRVNHAIDADWRQRSRRTF